MTRKEIYKLKALDTAVKVRNQEEYDIVADKFKEYTGVYNKYNSGQFNKKYPYIEIFLDYNIDNKDDRIICGNTSGNIKDYIYETIENFLENFEDKEETTVGIKQNKLLEVDFKVQKDNKTIVLDIVHMDESLRGNNDNRLLAQSKDKVYNYTIWSNNYPTMGALRLILKGKDTSRDNDFVYYTFSSTEEMNKYIEEMNKLIDEINKGGIIIDFNNHNFDKDDKLVTISNDYKVVFEGNRYYSDKSKKALRILSRENDTCQGWVITESYNALSFEEVKVQFEKFFKDRGLNVILK